MRGVLASVGLALLLATGCERGGELPMSTPQFVDVMVELRTASMAGGDYAARRAEILRKAGVTEATLRQYVQEASRRPDRLAEAFDSITARLLIANQVQ